jgi:hypothetical protein
MYGKFFYFMRYQFVKFCERLRCLNTTFEISCVPAEELHQKFPDARFDRIDVSSDPCHPNPIVNLTVIGLNPRRQPLAEQLPDAQHNRPAPGGYEC